MGSLTVDRDAWDDARKALGDDNLLFTPYLLPRMTVSGALPFSECRSVHVTARFGERSRVALDSHWPVLLDGLLAGVVHAAPSTLGPLLRRRRRSMELAGFGRLTHRHHVDAVKRTRRPLCLR